MEQIDYTKIIPTTPPEGLVNWIKSKNKNTKNYLVYRASWLDRAFTGKSEKAVECTCTNCTESSLMPYARIPSCSGRYNPPPFGFINEEINEVVFSGDTTVCPICGEDVQAIHTGNISSGGTVISEYYPMTIEHHGGRIVLIGWSVREFLYKSGRIITDIEPYEAYISEEKKLVKLVGYVWGCYGGRTLTGKWKQLKRFTDTWRDTLPEEIYPWNPDILIGTSAENCKLDVYLKSIENGLDTGKAYPVTYMNLWIKKKNVENLIMTGAGALINSTISGYCYPYSGNHMVSITKIKGIDFKKVKPHEMVGLTKEDYKEAVRSEWGCSELGYYKRVKDHSVKAEMVIKTINVIPAYKIDDVKIYENDFSRIYRYIIKQQIKYPDIYPEPTVDILADYWRMAHDRGYDLNDINTRYPQNLVRSHDTLANEIEYEKNKEKEEQFRERFNELYKYSYCTDNFEIHPARSPEEMVHEGKVLHHCVGSYVDRHAQGKTAIFFIRKRTNPDKPYYTLELDIKTLTVRQNRGRRNCARTKPIEEFEAAWLEFIKSQSIMKV